MERIENQTYDQERALYALTDAEVVGCSFEGPADGESALKEALGCTVSNSNFMLRYPLWHTSKMEISGCTFGEGCRAGLWYGSDSVYSGCTVQGVKFLRECDGMTFTDCDITSDEFGWKCSNIVMSDCKLTSQYVFLDSCHLRLNGVKMKAKYSFQYVSDMIIDNCDFDTKDAFWHAKNVTVRNSTIKGEYLGWYSENLTLENCRIIGTQPLCYCKGLKLVDCTMEGCDLSFEYSEVKATVKGNIDSVKNPLRGTVVADSVGEVIMTDDAVYKCKGKVLTK